MPSACLIVYEKKPRWAVALRRALQNPSLIVEVRSFTGVAAAIAAAPASLVFLDVQEKELQPALDWLDDVGRHFPQVRVLVALPQELASAELLYREAGAIDVLYFTLQVPAVARMAQRQLAQAPRDQLTVRESIAERMPWPAFAVAQP